MPVAIVMMCVSLLAPAAFGQDTPAAGPESTWGYVDNVDGSAITLDEGTVVKLTDATKIVRVDGSEGTPEDIVRGVKAEIRLDGEGNAMRVELLPAPLAPEYYLSNLTVRGATTVGAEVGGRTYPRTLSAIKASFVGRTDTVALVGGVAFTPPKEAKAGGARFAVVNSANDVLFQRTVKAGESSDFRLNFPAGQAETFTLLVSPIGEGTLQPEWCLWLDPKLVAPLPAPQGVGVLQSTVRALLADLKQALGEAQPGPMAIALFTPLRIRDAQIMRDFQEDLVVAGVGQFQIVGKSAQQPELGMPLPDAAKKDAEKLGAKCVLVGSVSDRGEILVVNAALMDVASGQIVATARAWQ